VTRFEEVAVVKPIKDLAISQITYKVVKSVHVILSSYLVCPFRWHWGSNIELSCNRLFNGVIANDQYVRYLNMLIIFMRSL